MSRLLGLVAAAGALALALLVGCSVETREKVLPYFFDGFSAEEQRQRPPTRRVRRDLVQEVEQLKRQLVDAQAQAKAGEGKPIQDTPLVVEHARGWPEASQMLAKDSAGHVDWVGSLKAGTIAPRPAIDPKGLAQAVLDLDIDLAGKAPGLFRVRFSHATHTEWLTCGGCHPAIFPLKQRAGPTVVSMGDIKNGKYCGVCHGPVTFGLESGCPRCHTAIPATSRHPAGEPRKPIERVRTWTEAEKLLPVTQGVSDWSRALAEGVVAPRPGIDPKATDEDILTADVVRVPREGKQYTAVFSHAAHTAWVTCDSCHPTPFQQEAGKTRMSMDMISDGKLCGTCHGSVAFSTDACARCHPALAEGK